jgi:hypothetical protein
MGGFMLLLAAVLAGANAQPAVETIQYRTSEALVVDRDGKPLFRAPRDFLLQVSGNSQGRVLAYDAERRMILVSEHQPWWIPCTQLQPQAVACAEVAKAKTRSIKLPGQTLDDGSAGLNAQAVPSCPGDPRCPRGS